MKSYLYLCLVLLAFAGKLFYFFFCQKIIYRLLRIKKIIIIIIIAAEEALGADRSEIVSKFLTGPYPLSDSYFM